MKSFGSYLKTLRKGAMTQRELAQRIGVGYPYICKLEKDVEPSPSEEVLEKIADVFDIDRDDVFQAAGKLPKDLKNYILKYPEVYDLLKGLQQNNVPKHLIKEWSAMVQNPDGLYFHLFHRSEKVMLMLHGKTAKIMDANTAASNFYGYSIEQLTNMHITDINILPREQVLQAMNSAVMERQNQFFFKHRLSSGEIKTVEVHSNPVIIGGKRYLLSTILDAARDNGKSSAF